MFQVRQCTYPSLGEVVRFAFSASGLLANRDRRDAGAPDKSPLTDTRVKTIQQQLKRLADESGALQPQLDALLEVFGQELSIYVTSRSLSVALTDLINDLYESYFNLIKHQGTHMSKGQSVRTLTTLAVRTCVLSCVKQRFFESFEQSSELRPDAAFWFLPVEEEGELVTPLHKVLAWAYEACECTPAQFHRPSGRPDTAGQLARNLDTARKWKWLSKRGLPSMSALHRNLSQSFEALAMAGHPIDEKLQKTIISFAAVARIASHVAQEVEGAFGRAFLLQTCQQIQLYCSWLEPSLKAMSEEVQTLFAEHRMPHLTPEANRKTIAAFVWRRFEDRCSQANQIIQSSRGSDGAYNPLCVQWVEQQYGPFAAFVDQDITSRWVIDKPAKFDELMYEAMILRQLGTVTLENVDSLEARLIAAGVSARVPWVVPWLRGVVLYHADNFEEAAEHYAQAFLLGRYSAGAYQYKLINQYLEVMAKTGRWVAFKKGVYWARYLGLSVRFLRDAELTEQNIRGVFETMGLQNLKYAHT